MIDKKSTFEMLSLPNGPLVCLKNYRDESGVLLHLEAAQAIRPSSCISGFRFSALGILSDKGDQCPLTLQARITLSQKAS